MGFNFDKPGANNKVLDALSLAGRMGTLNVTPSSLHTPHIGKNFS